MPKKVTKQAPFALRNLRTVLCCPLKGSSQTSLLGTCIDCENHLGITKDGKVKCKVLPKFRQHEDKGRYCMDCEKRTKNLKECVKQKHRILW